MNIIQYFSEIGHGVASLLRGMRITSGYFFSPGEIVTQKYPENRKTLVMPERFRGEITMPHDAENFHRCTGCGICDTNCPNDSIQVITQKNEEGKRILQSHTWHAQTCTLCGICVKTCPSNALAFGQTFEHAVFNRDKLTKTLNQPGSSLKKEAKS